MIPDYVVSSLVAFAASPSRSSSRLLSENRSTREGEGFMIPVTLV
jgi:hypothetical protein